MKESRSSICVHVHIQISVCTCIIILCMHEYTRQIRQVHLRKLHLNGVLNLCVQTAHARTCV